MEKLSLKQIAYNTIKQKIIDCEYMPNSFLHEASLIEEIGASRTPIREAVNRLEQENLVTILPKRGVVVSGFTLRDIDSVYETRQVIECYVIEQYGGRIDRERLAVLKADMESHTGIGDIAWHSQVDNDFHSLLINACANLYFHQMMDQIYIQNHRMRILSCKNGRELPATLDEHIVILDHLLKEDYAGASRSMRHHLDRAKQSIMNLMLDFAPIHSMPSGL